MSQQSVGFCTVFALLVSALLCAAPAAAECTNTICAGDPCVITGTHLLDDGCVLDFGAKTVAVNGSASLKAAVAGGSFSIKAGNFTVQGLLQAPGGTVGVYPTIGIVVTGNFKTETVNNSPGTIDVKANGPTVFGTVDISAGGTVTLSGKEIDADAGTSTVGGCIVAKGSAVTVAGPLHAVGGAGSGGGDVMLTTLSGNLSISGSTDVSGAGDLADAGTVTLTAAGTISVSGAMRANGTRGGMGGSTTFTADSDVTLTAALSANGSGDAGMGGSITITADGAATLNGALDANGGSGGGSGGAIAVTAASVSTQSDWSANAGSGADEPGTIDVTSTSGTITTTVTSALTANGSGGGMGGTVTITGAGDVTLAGNIAVTTGGDGSIGGSIDVSARTTHKITVSGILNARSASTSADSSDGNISIGPACDIRISGTLRTRNIDLSSGYNVITYRNSADLSGATLLADDDDLDGGNFIDCRCAGLAPDGTCPEPRTCQTLPTVTGTTFTPARTDEPIPLGPCVGCPNGVLDVPSEECDDGNFVNGDGCDSNCTTPRCGNGVTSSGEVCDDGNLVDGDGCDSNCTVTACGNGIITGTEQCDDGNTVDTDCCATCTILDTGSPCSDGNSCTQSDTCQAGTCTGSVLPDGTPCDDGNACTTDTQCASGICGGGSSAANDCCCEHPASTCNTPACNLCVCFFGRLSSCCNSAWDATCVAAATNECASLCSCTAATPTASLTATPTDTVTATPTQTPTVTNTPTVTPGGAPTVAVNLGTAVGRPGGIACLPATLAASIPVTTTRNDMGFSAGQFTAGSCKINPTIAKSLSQSTLGPGSERIDVGPCDATALPNGQLYACPFTIGAAVSPGDYSVSNVPSAADASCGAIAPVSGATGHIIVTTCTGDCNGNGRVTIGEVVNCVNMFLGASRCDPMDASRSCPVADADNNGVVSIGEVVGCVNRFLGGC